MERGDGEWEGRGTMASEEEPKKDEGSPKKTSDGEAFRRAMLAMEDRCPQCGGELDTGWECNDCGYDARSDAIDEREKRK
jgi:hypothetical protein